MEYTDGIIHSNNISDVYTFFVNVNISFIHPNIIVHIIIFPIVLLHIPISPQSIRNKPISILDILNKIEICILCACHSNFNYLSIMRLLVTTKNQMKRQEVFEVFGIDEITTYEPPPNINPEQPFGMKGDKSCALVCATNRTFCVPEEFVNGNNIDLIISIENGIVCEDGIYYDICEVHMYDVRKQTHITTQYFNDKIKIPVHKRYIDAMLKDAKEVENGYSITVGSIIVQDQIMVENKVASSNWMEYYGVPRNVQIRKSLQYCYNLLQSNITNIGKNMRTIPDYPQKGVLFQDMFSLFENQNELNIAMHKISTSCYNMNITKVVGLESRGFLLGILVANILMLPFVPIRKKGKLPPPTIKQDYEKEYGVDTCEIWTHAINENDNVLIIDDILATGGSLEAGIKLIELSGGTVAMYAVLSDVAPLREKAKEKLGKYKGIVLFE